MKKIIFILGLLLFIAFSIKAQTPAITSFTPASGPVGTMVTINGADLTAPTAFSIGAVTAITVSNDGTTLVGIVMPGAVTGAVTVTTAAGSATAANNFTVTPAPGLPTQQGPKLVGAGAIGNAQQAQSVSVSADGNTAIVGGNRDNNYIGAVWIYTRNAGIWSQQGSKLVGTGSLGNPQQGYSVSLSADGNTALVGGPADGGTGALWVFTRSGAVWSQQGSKLVGTGATGGSWQGQSVSLSADGNTALVGGYNDNYGIGAGWIFTRNGSVWSQQGAKLVGTGSIGLASQGWSVSLSGDGNTALVGGFRDNNSAGAAWIFTRSNGLWSQQGLKLVGSGSAGTAPQQGQSVSLSADGNTAVVGGLTDNTFIGAVWVYTRSGAVWTQQGPKLVGTGVAGSGATQGSSVSLSADGNIVLVGGISDSVHRCRLDIYPQRKCMDPVWQQTGRNGFGE